jgi:hypothetical protein
LWNFSAAFKSTKTQAVAFSLGCSFDCTSACHSSGTTERQDAEESTEDMKAEPQRTRRAPVARRKKTLRTRLTPPAQTMPLLNLELSAQTLDIPAIERRFYRCTPQA